MLVNTVYNIMVVFTISFVSRILGVSSPMNTSSMRNIYNYLKAVLAKLFTARRKLFCNNKDDFLLTRLFNTTMMKI